MKPATLFAWCLLYGALAAHAFVLRFDASGTALRWNLSPTFTAYPTNVVNTNTQAIRFFLAADAWSATNTTAELNALRAAFAQWQAVPSTGLKFEDAGLVAPGVDVNTADNTNVVYWAKAGTLVNGGHDSLFGALGATFTATFADGTLKEADIVLNGSQFAWFTDWFDTNNAGYFVEAVALHEIGHFLGLNHSPVGGATMLAQSAAGVATSQLGLAADDLAAVRFLYPAAQPLTNLATLRGQVMKGGAGVYGAVVTAEDATGNVVSATVTRTTSGTDGAYELGALPAGNYQVRVTPLNPAGTYALIAGKDIDIQAAFVTADTSFLPTTNSPVTLTAGATNTLNFAVVNGPPSFRISRILSPDGNFGRPVPTSVALGQSNLTVGVLSPDFPTSGATLSVTGDGLAISGTTVDTTSFFGLKLLTVTLDVATNATPGLRSFVVQQGTNLAYANGFLEVLPAFPDVNFDGLDDAFQRRYFPLFTAAPAAPGADPDGDGFSNYAEYISGTVPTNAASLLRLESVTQNTSGTTLAWQSATGKRYQISRRSALVTAPWQNLGGPMTATNNLATFLDAAATNGMKFYRVQALP